MTIRKVVRLVVSTVVAAWPDSLPAGRRLREKMMTMASYDSPGFVSPIPGNADFAAHDGAMTAPGTPPPGAGIDAGVGGVSQDAGTLVTVAVPGASYVNADTWRVGPRDTLVPSEAQSYGATPDPLTGLGSFLGDTGAGQGRLCDRHPNSMWRTAGRP